MSFTLKPLMASGNGMRDRYRAVMPRENRFVNAIITPDEMLAAIGIQ